MSDFLQLNISGHANDGGAIGIVEVGGAGQLAGEGNGGQVQREGPGVHACSGGASEGGVGEGAQVLGGVLNNRARELGEVDQLGAALDGRGQVTRDGEVDGGSSLPLGIRGGDDGVLESTSAADTEGGDTSEGNGNNGSNDNNASEHF